MSQQPVSLEKPVGEDEDEELGSLLADLEALSPEGKTVETAQTERIRKLLYGLTPREERIIYMRLGLFDGRKYTLKEIGQRFGLTKERIRQIEKEALKKLRWRLFQTQSVSSSF